MKFRNNRVEPPRGFLMAAGEAGLRTHGTGPDVGLIYSEVPARVAALFTANRVKAAPVEVSRQHLSSTDYIAQAIVVNAGNANCATGSKGVRVAKQCAARAAELFRIRPEEVLIASTGVIGVPLDASRITDLLPSLAARLRPEGYQEVAKAILTTDTRPKVVCRTVNLAGAVINILGIAKGAGMINPSLATMLAFLFTDAAINGRLLRAAARRVGDASFNRISVDGDTSTNDTVFIMANGMAGNATIVGRTHAAETFVHVLTEVAQQLAIKIVKDGEGARKLVEVRVEKGATEAQVSAIARSIGLSLLVKTALAGADPNWGRILSAAGNAGVEFNPNTSDIYLNDVLVCRRGQGAYYDEPGLRQKLERNEIVVRLVLREGSARAMFWTSDLTEEYVRINASYRT